MAMSFPLSMRYPGAPLVEEEEEKTMVFSAWRPGRYSAFVREECESFCLRLSHSRLGCHRHFAFKREVLTSYFEALQEMAKVLATTVDSNPSEGLTVNDWRYTDEHEKVVEMKLDAPGSDQPEATTFFGAELLDEAQESYWIAEEHMGSYRAKRIADEACMRTSIGHMADENNARCQERARDIVSSPYMHQVLGSDSHRVVYIDGDMLNNRPDNIRIEQYLRRASAPASAASSPCGSDDDDAMVSLSATPPNQHKKRKRAHQRQTNNQTGVTGLSLSADQTRFQIKVRANDGTTIRKSFNVLGAAAASSDPELLEQRKLEAHARAKEFMADHSSKLSSSCSAHGDPME